MSLINHHKTHPPSRVMVFIDGGYVKKWVTDILKMQLKQFSFGQLSIAMTTKAFVDLESAQIIRTYFYDGLVEPNDSRYNDQKKFHDYLRRTFTSYDVRVGHLVKDGKGEFRQKGVDVLMAIDMIEKANTNQYDTAIVLAGDLDHIETIKTVRNKGKQTVGFFHDGTSSIELQRYFDLNINLKKLDVELLRNPETP